MGDHDCIACCSTSLCDYHEAIDLRARLKAAEKRIADLKSKSGYCVECERLTKQRDEALAIMRGIVAFVDADIASRAEFSQSSEDAKLEKRCRDWLAEVDKEASDG